MPIAPAELFSRVALTAKGTVRWGEVPDTAEPGVYAVSLCADPKCNTGLLVEAPIDTELVAQWIGRVPAFCFNGVTQPRAELVTAFLKTFWLDDESILYIGKATSLHHRLGQYRGHRLGNRSPHAGGHWLKTLTNINSLFTHYCTVPTAEIAKAKESEALAIFKSQVSPAHVGRVSNPIPFANREHPQGNCKQDNIRRDVLR